MSRSIARTLFATLILTGACAGSDDTESTFSKDDARAAGKADDGRDYCAEFGWYGDGVCDDFCLDRDSDCASDARRPELGDHPEIVFTSAITMGDALAKAEAERGVNIEAKFELGDNGKLSLSLYPLGQPLDHDAERNVFQELAGDPTAATWSPGLEVFHDQEHLTRSSRDLTLVQLSRHSLRDAVAAADQAGFPYWAIPTIQGGRAGYGLYLMIDGDESAYVCRHCGTAFEYSHTTRTLRRAR